MLLLLSLLFLFYFFSFLNQKCSDETISGLHPKMYFKLNERINKDVN